MISSLGLASAVAVRMASRRLHSTRTLSSSNKHSVADMRQEYHASPLVEGSVPAEPVQLFESWLAEARAAGVHEPNAMCLATVGPHNRPSARFVLLKGCDARGFVFYTNYESRKGDHLEQNFAVAATFWWAALERSVRIEGFASKIDPSESDAYYASRPRGSRLGAWTSEQSRPIRSRSELDEKQAAVETRFSDKQSEIPRPPHWGAIALCLIGLSSGLVSLADCMTGSSIADNWLQVKIVTITPLLQQNGRCNDYNHS